MWKIYYLYPKQIEKDMPKKHLFVAVAFGIAALLPLHAQDMVLMLMQGNLPYQGTSWSFSGSGQPLQQDKIKFYLKNKNWTVWAGQTQRGWLIAM